MKAKMFKKIKKVFWVKKQHLPVVFLLFGLVVFSVFAFPGVAKALDLLAPVKWVVDETGELLLRLLTLLCLLLINLFGKLLAIIAVLIVDVAQYNNIVNVEAVARGWLILRDICNLFFVVFLLFIAFSTVLGIERYSAKRTLGALIVAAVLINFSRFICGAIIDLAQIIMLVFVSAFKDMAIGNFTDLLGIDKLLSMSSGGEGTEIAEESGFGEPEVFMATFFALIMVLISLVVVGILFLILVARIVALWLLTILSPIAFVGHILPATQAYARQWWDKFINYVIIGPVMAFMLWLTLTVASVSIDDVVLKAQLENEKMFSVKNAPDFLSATINKASSAPHILSYALAIGMLLGCLLIPQKLGTIGGKMAGKAVAKIEGAAKGVTKSGFGLKPLANYWQIPFAAKELGGRVTRKAEKITHLPLTKETREARRMVRRGRIEEFLGGKKGAKHRAELEQRAFIKKKLEEQVGPLNQINDRDLEEMMKGFRPHSLQYQVVFEEKARRAKLKSKDIDNFATYIIPPKTKKDKDSAEFMKSAVDIQGGVASRYFDYNFTRDEKDRWRPRDITNPKDKEERRRILESIRDEYGRKKGGEINTLDISKMQVKDWGIVAAEAYLSLDDQELAKVTKRQKEKILEQLEEIARSENIKGIEDKKSQAIYRARAQEKINRIKGQEGSEGKEQEQVGDVKEFINSINESNEMKTMMHLGEPNYPKISINGDVSSRQNENKELLSALNTLATKVNKLADTLKDEGIKDYARQLKNYQKELERINTSEEDPVLLRAEASKLSKYIADTLSNLRVKQLDYLKKQE